MPASNQGPTITNISPNTGPWDGPAFTLTVNGSGFISSSTVQWNESPRATTFVSSSQLTAQIPATDMLASGTETVAVDSSNSVTFTVPCVLASAGPASTQTMARLGAYYFDGWSSPLSNFHFDGLLSGTYADREPLSGWQDNTTCAVQQQLAWAHEFGINYFVFDWYYNLSVNEPGDNLNYALQTTFALPNRLGMQFAILYVDSPPFVVPPSGWASAIDEWLGYMTDPDYVQVNGKPLLVVYSISQLEQALGSSAAVADSFNQLRVAAQAKGLAGVYVVGGLDAGYDPNTQGLSINNLPMAAADGYDAFSLYNYSHGTLSGSQPFSSLVAGMQEIWGQVVLTSPLPFIPVAMDGWDARPWNEGDVWFSRAPQDVTNFVSSAISWAELNPSFRPEAAPTPPLVLIEAWNELGEGGFLVPTLGDGTSYGDSLATMLSTQALHEGHGWRPKAAADGRTKERE